MDRKSWLEFNIRGEALRHPRKPDKDKLYDTLVLDCTFNNADEVFSLVKSMKAPGRMLIVVPSNDSLEKFPEEAGKVWDEIALREVINHIIKFSNLKQKLFFKCYPEINDGYTYFYIALAKEAMNK